MIASTQSIVHIAKFQFQLQVGSRSFSSLHVERLTTNIMHTTY